MSSGEDEIYFDAPEDIDETELPNLNPPSTPERELIRNRIESLKKSAIKFDQNLPLTQYPRFDSIEPSSTAASVLSSSHFNTIPSGLNSSRLLSRTFPEKGFLLPNSNSDFIRNDFETYAHVRSRTTQPAYFSPPVLSPQSFERSNQPMSSAPEVSLRRIHHQNREDYTKSWSLDAARFRPQQFFSNDRPSHLISPRAPLPMEPLLDRSEGSELDKSLPSLQSPGCGGIGQAQGLTDACVQANIITEKSLTETLDSLQLDPDGHYPTMMRAKTGAAATLPGAGNSSMNPMSLDYRTRTLSVSSLHRNGSPDKLEGERNGSNRGQNLMSGFRKIHTAFRGAVNAVRLATKATKIFSQDEPTSEEDDEVIGNQGIRLRCSRKMKGHKEFLQIKLVQKLDNEHIGAIWAMRVSPCGRLLATAGYDRNIRIWVLRQWYNHYRNMLQSSTSQQQRQHAEDGTSSLGDALIDDLDIDSVSMTSVSLSTQLDEGGSSCSSSTGLLESVSISTRGVTSPSDLLLVNSTNGGSCVGGRGGGESHHRRGAVSGSALYHPQPLLVYRGHEGVITELAWSKNLFLLSTGMDRQVRLWHISRRECLCAFSHNDTVPAIVFHPKDDRYFLSGSLDGKLRLWNIPDKKVRFWVDVPLPSCLPSLHSAASSSSAGSAARSGSSWNGGASGGGSGHGGIEPKTIITCATFACDSTKVVVGSYDGRVMFFSTELTYITFITVKSVSGRFQQCRVTAIEVDPTDSNKILVTSNDSRVRLIDARDYHTLCKYRGFLNETSQIRASFSSTGRYIISGSENCFFYIWRKQMDFLNISRFSSTRKDRNNCWEAIRAHDAVVTVALFLPASENLLLDPHRRHSRRHPRRPGVEFIVSADCNGCLRVFRNRAPVTQTATAITSSGVRLARNNT